MPPVDDRGTTQDEASQGGAPHDASMLMAEQPQEEDRCWICHGSGTAESPLNVHCKCHSMKAHDSCIAHWQLRNAGTVDELKCRLCHTPLPDWRGTAMNSGGRSLAKHVTLAVQVNGRTKYMKVRIGSQSPEEFSDKLKRAFGLPDSTHLDIDFTVQNPFAEDQVKLQVRPTSSRGSRPTALAARRPALTFLSLSLSVCGCLPTQGMNSYDAAIHCGAIMDADDGSGTSGMATDDLLETSDGGGESDRESSEEREYSSEVGSGDEIDLEVRAIDRYERSRQRRMERIRMEQLELRADADAAEEILEAAAPTRATRERARPAHQEAGGDGGMDALPTSTSQALLSCMQALCPKVRRKRRRVAAVPSNAM